MHEYAQLVLGLFGVVGGAALILAALVANCLRRGGLLRTFRCVQDKQTQRISLPLHASPPPDLETTHLGQGSEVGVARWRGKTTCGTHTCQSRERILAVIPRVWARQLDRMCST